jgi:hypothetical protein
VAANPAETSIAPSIEINFFIIALPGSSPSVIDF